MNGSAGAMTEVQAMLEARARIYARPPVAEDAAGTVEMLRFSAGSEEYAIAIAYVLRIIPMPRITPLPHGPAQFAGVASHRGDLFPVVDLARLRGAVPTQDATHLVVLGRTHPDIALLAGEIAGIEHLAPDALGAIDGAALLEDPRLVVGPRPGAPTITEETQ